MIVGFERQMRAASLRLSWLTRNWGLGRKVWVEMRNEISKKFGKVRLHQKRWLFLGNYFKIGSRQEEILP